MNILKAIWPGVGEDKLRWTWGEWLNRAVVDNNEHLHDTFGFFCLDIITYGMST